MKRVYIKSGPFSGHCGIIKKIVGDVVEVSIDDGNGGTVRADIEACNLSVVSDL